MLGQLWSNTVLDKPEQQQKPVVTNESVVNQTDSNYYNYKAGILQGILKQGETKKEGQASYE